MACRFVTFFGDKKFSGKGCRAVRPSNTGLSFFLGKIWPHRIGRDLDYLRTVKYGDLICDDIHAVAIITTLRVPFLGAEYALFGSAADEFLPLSLSSKLSIHVRVAPS